MATLAVDQHQRVVWRQTAQVSRSHQCRRVTNGLVVYVVGGHDITEQVAHVGIALIVHGLAADHVNGSG